MGRVAEGDRRCLVKRKPDPKGNVIRMLMEIATEHYGEKLRLITLDILTRLDQQASELDDIESRLSELERTAKRKRLK